MDRDEYRRTSLENWQTMAPGWERRRAELERFARPVTDSMLRALDPQPGDTLLELAAGPGDTGFQAAAALGEHGRLISTDFSSEMVEVARRRARELDVRNAEYLVVDAEEIPLDDDSVDGVICRFGLMLMADPERALAESRRVVRPGGRLVLAVWGARSATPGSRSRAGFLRSSDWLRPPSPERRVCSCSPITRG